MTQGVVRTVPCADLSRNRCYTPAAWRAAAQLQMKTAQGTVRSTPRADLSRKRGEEEKLKVES